MRKSLTGVLILCLCTAWLPTVASAFAEQQDIGGGLTYTVDDNGILTISGDGALHDCTLDNDFSSQDSPFPGNSGITAIVLEEGVTGIGDRAFKGMSGVESVSLPDSLEYIGEEAFMSDRSLRSVDIPSGVKSLGKGAFHACSNLSSAVLPDNITSLPDEVFKECPIGELTIPKTVTYIGENAFMGGTFESLVIPDSVKTVGNAAFNDCESLKSITFPKECTIGTGVLMLCFSLTNVTMPENMPEIPDYTFNFCQSLTSYEIPDTATRIGINAFSYCTGLTEFTVPLSVKEIGEAAFYCCSEMTDITFMNGNCVIHEDYTDFTIEETTAIHGYEESKAQEYAKVIGRKFISMGEDPNRTDLSSAGITGITDKVYTGKGITQTPVVRLGDQILIKGTDYTLTYRSNVNVGTAAVTISGIEAYRGSMERTFRINPKGVVIKKPKAGKKKITVKWKKQGSKMSASRITGYQIQYSRNKSFRKSKTKTVKGYKKTSKVIRKLKNGKRYYVRVRTFKTVSNTKYYSP